MKKFILLATVLLVSILVITNLNYYEAQTSYFDNGYMVGSDDIVKILTDDEKGNEKINLDLISISSEDEVYIKGNNTYVGTDKQLVNTYFPMFTNGGSSLKFYDGATVLIANDFTLLRSFNGMSLSDGTSYNQDNAQADGEEFILATLSNGLMYVVQNTTINNNDGIVRIPVNSLVDFKENKANFFYFADDKLVFEQVPIYLQSTISIGDNTYTYSDFLKLIGKIRDIVKNGNLKGDLPQDITIPQAGDKAKNNGSGEKDNTVKTDDNDKQQEPGQENIDKGDSEGSDGSGDNAGESGGTGDSGDDSGGEGELPPPTPEDGYFEPEVSCTGLEPWVYNVFTNTEIYDPQARVYKGVKFYVYRENGTLFTRFVSRKAGDTKIGLLEPNTKYTIVGDYTYYDETSTKVVESFLAPTAIQTLSYEQGFAPIKVSYDEADEYFSSSIKINNLKALNPPEYKIGDESINNYKLNSMYFVSNIRIEFDEADKYIDFEKNTLDMLKRQEETDVVATGGIKSSSEYHYKMVFYDRFGNKIPTSPAIVEDIGKTSKLEPKAQFKIVKNLPADFEFNLSIVDVDGTRLPGTKFRFYVKDEAGKNLLIQGDIDGQSFNDYVVELDMVDSKIMSIKNLPFSKTLTMYVESDYNTGVGGVDQFSKAIGSLRFPSATISNGAMSFNTNVLGIDGTKVNLEIIPNTRSNKAITDLVTDIGITVNSKTDSITSVLNKEKVNALTEDNKIENGYIIQYGNVKLGTPEIKLVSDDPNAFNEGIWQALINSINPDKPETKILVNYLEGTLTSATEYILDIKPTIKMGDEVYPVICNITNKEFKTQKKNAVVTKENMFVSQGFVEIYNLLVTDTDDVVGGKVYGRLRYDDYIVDKVDLEIGEEIPFLRFENLYEGKNYVLEIVAETYNNGYTLATQKSNYVFASIPFEAGKGVSGSIYLNQLQKTFQNAENLVNKSEFELEKTLNWNGGLDGLANTFTTGYIAVSTDSDYYLDSFKTYNSVGRVSFYDENYKHIKTMDQRTSGFNMIASSIPINARYMRVSGLKSYIDAAGIYKNMPTGDNLIKKEEFTQGIKLDGYGIAQVDINYSVSNYVEVEPGARYAIDGDTRNLAVYNANYELIGYFGYVNPGQVLRMSDSAKYVRISNTVAGLDTVNLYIKKIGEMSSFYNAGVQIKLNDENNDLVDTPYYRLKIYRSDTLDEHKFVKISDEENELHYFDYSGNGVMIPVEDIFKYQFDANKAYKLELSIDYQNREILMDTLIVETIYNAYVLYDENDLLMLLDDPMGNYVVAENITLSSQTINNSLYYLTFNGVLDFQGHRLVSKTQYNFISTLGESGVIKDLIYDPSEAGTRTLLATNKGKISNLIYIHSQDKTYTNTHDGSLLIYHNASSGILENFVVRLQASYNIVSNNGLTYGPSGIIAYNDGLIQNGYIMSENKYGYVTATENIGYGFVARNRDYGKIRNVYTNYELYSTSSTDNVGLLVSNNNVTSVVENCFSYGNVNTYNPGPPPELGSPDVKKINVMVGTGSGAIKNTSFMSNYNYAISEKTPQIALKNIVDPSWHESVINQGGAYNLTETVSAGYMPRINLPMNMMNEQPFVLLPTVNESKVPVLLSSTVLEQKKDEATVELTFENPNKMEVKSLLIDGLDNDIITQFDDFGIYRVRIRVYKPQRYYSSYDVKKVNFTNAGVNVSITPKHAIKCEFYREIDTAVNWNTYIESDLNANYRIVNDLDFGVITNDDLIYILGTFKGKIDGGKYDEEGNLSGSYTLSNIYIGDTRANVFQIVTGTIKNLQFDNVIIDASPTILTKQNYGLIHTLNSEAVIDNVYLMNSKYDTGLVTGGIAAASNNATIKNSAVINTTFTDKATSRLMLGGLVGESTSTTITNCFTSNIEIKTLNTDPSNVVGVGGLIGSSNASNITNNYTYGNISGTSNIGGLVGNTFTMGSIHDNMTNVTINTTGSSVGGIIGKVQSGGKAYENIVFGDIIASTESSTTINRIAGGVFTNSRNYFFDQQFVLGDNKSLMDATGSLTVMDLADENTYRRFVGFDSNFDYSSIFAMLPKLRNSDTKELLPLQTDIMIKNENIKLTVEQSSIIGEDLYAAQFLVKHEGMVIDSVEVDGMNIIEKKLTAKSDSETIVELRMNLKYAFDKYNVKVNLKTIKGSGKISINGTFDFGKPLYKEVKNINEWQTIMSTSGDKGENIKVTGNIDFKSISKPVTNIVVNRLEGIDPHTSKITNFAYTFKDYNENLIKVVSSDLSNIAFDNIKVSYSTALTLDNKNLGVIGQVAGNVNSVEISNIDIKMPSRVNTAGFISTVLGNIGDVKINNLALTTSGTSVGTFIGGFAGKTNGYLRNIEAKDIRVNATANYVGGLIGNAVCYQNVVEKNYNVHMIDINVQGTARVGGIIGEYSTRGRYSDNFTVTSTNVANPSLIKSVSGGYVGGIAGMSNDRASNFIVKDVNVQASGNFVGGMYGHLSQYTPKDMLVDNVNVVGGAGYVGGFAGEYYGYDGIVSLLGTVKNSTVRGVDRVGGFAGYTNRGMSIIKVENTEISGTTNVGGILGYGTFGSDIRKAFGKNLTVKGGSNVGGIAGSGARTIIDSGIIDSEIEGIYVDNINSGLRVGGLMGKMVADPDYPSYVPSNYNNYVLDCTVTGSEIVGGIIGLAEDGLVQRTYSNATVTSSGNYVGGIAGRVLIPIDPTRYKYNNIIYSGDVVGNDYVSIGIGSTSKSFENSPELINDIVFDRILLIGNAKASADAKNVAFYANKIGGGYPGEIGTLSLFEGNSIQIGSNTTFVNESNLPIYVADNDNRGIIYTASELGTNNKYTDPRRDNGMGFDSAFWITGDVGQMYADELRSMVKFENHNVIELKTNEDVNGTYKIKLSNLDVVQDGLLINLDGNNNPSTTSWVSTVNGYELKPEMGEKYMPTKTEDGGYKFGTNTRISLNENPLKLLNPSEYTIETSFKMNANNHASIYSMNPENYHRANAIFYNKDSKKTNVYGTKSEVVFNDTKLGERESYSHVTKDVQFARKNYSIGPNGSNTAARNELSASGDYIRLGSWKDNTLSLDGVIYDFRIYTKALSDLDRYHNYSVSVADEFIETEAYVTFKNGIGEFNIPSNMSVGKYSFGIDIEELGLSTNHYGYDAGVEKVKLIVKDPEGNLVTNNYFDFVPTVTVETEGSVQWYRGIHPSDYTAGVKILGGVNKTETLYGRGYYYCTVTTDSGEVLYSDVLSVETDGYLPKLSINAKGSILPGQDGEIDSNDLSNKPDSGWYKDGVELPEDVYIPMQRSARRMMSSYGDTEGLPKVAAYASDVDMINIELDQDISESYNLIVMTKDRTLYDGPIDSRIKTFSYDFKDDLIIAISDGSASKQTVLAASELRKDIMVFGSNYGYITEHGYHVNNRKFEGDYIHIMNNKIIDSNGNVYNVESGELISRVTDFKEMKSKPLYEFTYEDESINTYRGYSTVNESLLQDMQLLVKNNKLFTFDSVNMKAKYDGLILDKYGEQEYYTVLNDNGKLTDLGMSLKYPASFKNEQISAITNTINSTIPIMLVRYESGNLVAFNYLTGEVIEVEGMKKAESLFDFVEGYISGLFAPNMNYLATDYKQALETSNMFVNNIDDFVGFADEEGMATEAGIGIDRDNTMSSEEVVSSVRDGQSDLVVVYNSQLKKFVTYTDKQVLNSVNITQEPSVDEIAKKLDVNKIDQISDTAVSQPIKNVEIFVMFGFAFIVISALLYFGLRAKKM